jgi:hypothetical protein
MQYALLIYSAPPQSEPSPEQIGAVHAQYNAYTGELRAADAMRGGEQLQDGRTATTVRVRDGKTIVTDGPFAETKEEFGGFYLIEAANLDEALKWAAKVPGAQWGSIEVRPIVPVMESMPTMAGAEAAAAG